MKEARFFLVSFSLLVIVGIPAAYSVVQDPTASASEMSDGSGRGPASVEDNGEAVRNSAKAKSVTLDWNCQDQSTLEKVDGTHLRLRGHLCDNQNPHSLSIVNESNGYTAAVILTKNEEFTTDFIELKDGDNQFQIAYVDNNGSKAIRHLTIKKVPGSFLQLSESIDQ
jgi:hypothetical protein